MVKVDLEWRITKVALLLFSIVIFGTISYHLIEGWSLFDSLYMTAMTVTTTGYRELAEMSTAGRVLSMVLMFVGVGVFFYTINLFMPVLVEMGRERWKKVLKDVKDHYIVCGYGVMGREIAEELPAESVVVIESDSEKVSLAREKGFLALQGDATEEDILEMANISTAKALIACLSTDAADAFAVMVAKDLNHDIYTIAVLRNPSGSKKVKRAGVDMLLSPYSDAAKKIYMTLKTPAAVELIDIISDKQGEFMLQKVTLSSEKVKGKSLQELDIRKKTGALVVAIERDDVLSIPQPETLLQKDDVLYVMGSNEQLEKLLKILS
ncbi:MAG: potassium channel family protein [Archaeoglobaceae archaeon]